MSAAQLPPPYDHVWHLRAARGEIAGRAALRFVRALNTLGVDEVRRHQPELADALEAGNRAHPRKRGRYPDPAELPGPIDVDPATMAVFDRLVASSSDGRRQPDPATRPTGTEGQPQPARPRRQRKGGKGGGGDDGGGGTTIPFPGSPDPELHPIAGRPGCGFRLGASPGVWKDGKPVLPWCPEVLEHLVRLDADGQVVERRYLVQVSASDPVLLTTKDLASSPSDGSCWCDRFPMATGVGTRSVRELLLDIVLEQASHLEPTWMVHRNGWRELPGGVWRYVRTPDPDRHVRPVYSNVNLARAYTSLGLYTDDEVTGALGKLPGHGWAPIFGLGVGARSLAWSPVPARHAVVVEGAPNTGKSLAAWMAQLPVLSPQTADGTAWPPVPDASFADTINSMERKIGEAADRVIHVNDMPLSRDSTDAEMRKAVEKLDHMARAQHDNVPVRDRLDQRLELRESTYVRGVLVFTVQRLPALVQPSLWRRLVVAHIDDGGADWQWYGEHGAELVGPLRALGDRMIRALEDMGSQQAAELALQYDREGRDLLWPAYRALGMGDVPGMVGVVDAAGQYVGGLLLVEALTGLATGPLLEVLVPALARSLAVQATIMRDRQAADSDVQEAVGSLYRKACLDRRAHTRDPHEDIDRPMVPGLTCQAQGVPEDSDRTGRAQGVSLYVFTDRQAVGVTPKDLHSLAADSRDPRLSGFGADGLARYLLREGASIPSRQKGKAAVWRERIGPRAGNVRRYLVMVPLAAVWDLPTGDDDAEPDDTPPPPEPEPAEPEPATLPLNEPAEAPQAPDVLGHGGRPTEAPPTPPAPDHRPTPPAARTGTSSPTAGLSSKTPPATIVAVEGGRLAVRRPGDDGGAWEFGDAEVTGDLVALLEQLARAVPSGPAVLLIGEGDTERYGLRPQPPGNPARPGALWRRVFEAGWTRPGHPDTPPMVPGYARIVRKGRPGMVLVLPVRWLRPPASAGILEGGVLPWPLLGVDDDADVVELADRLAELREWTGWDLDGGTPSTGALMFREIVEATSDRAVYWNPTRRRSWPTPTPHRRWRLDEAAPELVADRLEGATLALSLDAVACHLNATQGALLSPGDLHHYSRPTFDDEHPDRWAGYWRIVKPEWPWPEVPEPVNGVPLGDDAWVTTAVVKLYVEVGVSPELLEAYLGRRHDFGQRRFVAHLRALLEHPDTPPAVRAAVKHMYQSFHGKVDTLAAAWVSRPDFSHAIRDEALCSMLRKVYQAAGILALPKKVTGVIGRKAEAPMYPLEIGDTDTVIYAATPELILPEAFTIGEQLGDYRLKGTMPVDKWQEGTR